jgi:hypothetical protein
MGITSGEYGCRGLGRFVERHRLELIKILSIPQARVPSYSTIRRVMMGIDYKELTRVFNTWASQHGNIPSRERTKKHRDKLQLIRTKLCERSVSIYTPKRNCSGFKSNGE